jgi:hypothetical protein
MVSLSEGARAVGQRKKMLGNEKLLKQPIYMWIHIVHYTVNCWLSGDHSDREWVSNRGEGLIWWKHDTYRWEIPRWNPLGLSVHTNLKKQKAGEENKSFLGVGTSGRDWAQGKGE